MGCSTSKIFRRTTLDAFRTSKVERKLPPSDRRGGHEATHVHRTHGRGGGIAAGGTGTATCKDETHRYGFSIRTRRQHVPRPSSILESVLRRAGSRRLR